MTRAVANAAPRASASVVGPSSDADLAIVGGGAAGLSAAIHAASIGLATVLVETGSLGGEARRLVRIESVPGSPVGLSGTEFVERAVERAGRFGVRILTPARAVGIEGAHEGRGALPGEQGGPSAEVLLADGARVRARALLIATGVDRVVPGTPGVAAFLGVGVHIGLPAPLPVTARCKDVFLRGEAEAVSAAARRLSCAWRRVTIVTSHVGRADGIRLTPGEARPRNIEILRQTEIVALAGIDRLESLVLRNVRTGEVTARDAVALYLLERGRPRTAWLPPSLFRDAGGYLLTGDLLPFADGSPEGRFAHATSLPGVFAAGAVRAGSAPDAEAVVDGISAVLEVESWLGRVPA